MRQPPTSSRNSASKLGSAFKRVGRYLKDQAEEQSHSALYLSPAGRISQHQRNTNWYGNGETSNQDLSDQLVQKLTRVNHVPPYRFSGSPPTYSPTATPLSSSTMATNSASGPGIFQNMVRHQYASDNILQSYDVLKPQRQNSHTNRMHWVVFIHGGYFRDPKVDSTSFKPTISLIEESQSQTASTLHSRISGYASLNYRLAPHPAYPQDPKTTPSYTLNTSRWPNQLDDVMAGLQHLQRTYPDSKDYILVGHSVGATLAFLAVLKASEAGITTPRAVAGVSGIYDYPAIHKSNPDYEALTNNAMDTKYYEEASPALYSADQYEEQWHQEKRVIVIAHSRDDELVVWDQPEGMMKVFEGDGLTSELVELKGKHNEIWEQSGELVKAIEKAVELVVWMISP
ncbi:Kynurenine formamidase [Knufia obscura]|uniref:Kynurenine formamidase n=1 Tax=Knufia obscura TaxID=1635080 RepID=A0ABR0RIY2_9EURO|nr:Kynurenine formamidase [Knufia obscura]